jgi:hypothetical protein
LLGLYSFEHQLYELYIFASFHHLASTTIIGRILFAGFIPVFLFAKEMEVRHSHDPKMLIKIGLIAIVKINPIDIKLIPKKRKLR